MPAVIGEALYTMVPVDDTPLYARAGALPEEVVRAKYFNVDRARLPCRPRPQPHISSSAPSDVSPAAGLVVS